jgi:hypothetical protein
VYLEFEVVDVLLRSMDKVARKVIRASYWQNNKPKKVYNQIQVMVRKRREGWL